MGGGGGAVNMACMHGCVKHFDLRLLVDWVIVMLLLDRLEQHVYLAGIQ
jgi:hypothetical protein